MILVLFGPPGVGKNFVGRILQQEYDYHFYDADADLTEDMIAAIQQEQVFTPIMREEFFTIVTSKIKALQQQYKNIAVAQALIKEANRQQLADVFPEAQFLQIIADVENVNQRLKIRDNWISIEFAEKIRSITEAPQLNHHDIDNNLDRQHVHTQLNALV